jgi:chorismate mutase
MTSATHPDLDLVGTIRPGLDILANEIVIALKKRTRFSYNEPIYVPSLVLSDSSVSLLQHVLGRIESCHAELGRYTFATQDSFTPVSDIASVVDRLPPESPLQKMQSGVGERIIDFYRSWIQRACPQGNNSSTYGETVTSDVNALLAIMERVNLGKSVAEAKFLELTDEFMGTGGDRDALLTFIVRKEREVQVIELARRLAEHYEVPAEHIISVFEFMIETTINIEIDYLQRRIAAFA